jgi:hypothetical protein
MKTARSILSKTSGRVAIVYRKKGDSNLIGFTTDKQFSSDDSSFQTWMQQQQVFFDQKAI